MPEITTDAANRVAKDAFYVGVGLGVIAFQKAQVQRVELTKTLKGQVGEAKGQIDKIATNADAVEDRFEALLDEIEAKLPEQTREIMQQARVTARDARQQVRSVVGRAA
jgi:prefoldin subunit 5